MKYSLALASLIALGGQAYSQSVSGHYTIANADAEALTAGLGDSHVQFAAVDGAPTPSQIWDFAPVGPQNVVIQSQDDGDYNGLYLSCPESAGSPCTLSSDPQIFTPSQESGDRYSIQDETGKYLVVTDDKMLGLADDNTAADSSLFTLTQATQENERSDCLDPCRSEA